MSDFAKRDEWEKKLTRALAGVNDDVVPELLDALGDPPSLGNVPPRFWDAYEATLRLKLQGALEAVYVDMAKQTLTSSPIGVEWGRVNTGAAKWAALHTGDLVRGITANTQSDLRASLTAYFEQPTTLGELTRGINVPALTDALGRVIMPETRAEMIAITEVTRAAVAGEQAIVDAITRENPHIRMVARWQTKNDERVCPICGPRHGQLQGEGWFDDPPAHPRCRCWKNYEWA